MSELRQRIADALRQFVSGDDVERAVELVMRQLTCAEHKRALVCPNCEARKRGKKGARATAKKYSAEDRSAWGKTGGRPKKQSDAQVAVVP